MTSWKIDHNHSHVEFKAKHMMISTVRGQFAKFDGTVEFDLDRPEATHAEISIDAASLNTGVADRDNHLRSADFFEAERYQRYPTLNFVSKRVEVTGPDNAKLVGDLTIKDITREVVLNVEFAGIAQSPWGATQVGFNATTKVNRKDWNLTWNVALETGGWLVGDDVTINIELELVKVEEPVAATEVAESEAALD
jgi:polyisoprenoid-binding protein YceI